MTPATLVEVQPSNAAPAIPPPRPNGKSHATPVARLEDNKLATDFGLGILHKRISEIHHIIVSFERKEMPATGAWEQIVGVINRG